MTLNDIQPGDRARVIGFSGQGHKAYKRKLMAHGLTRGAVFQVSRLAPLGDPIEIIVRECSLCLRKAEACLLKVEIIDSAA